MIGFINGYNGYEKSINDGVMCACINNSLFNNGVSNIITDINGNYYHSENRRSLTFNV